MHKFITIAFLLLAPSLATAQGLDDCSGPIYERINVGTSGDSTIVTAVTGKKIRVLSFVLGAAAAVTARMESGAGGDALTGRIALTDSLIWQIDCTHGCFETNAGETLNLESGGAVDIDGHLTYALCN